MERREMGVKRFYKCTAPNGRSWHDENVRYIVGEVLEHPSPDPESVGECGQGYHCSPLIQQTVKYAQDVSRAEFFVVEIDEADIIARGADKVRTGKLRVLGDVTEMDLGILRGTLTDVLGYGDGSGDGYGYGSGYGPRKP